MLCLQMELFDTDRIRGCLEGKHIVLLGDSTMSETVHDLVLLVSGLANWPDQVNTYIWNATRYVSCLSCYQDPAKVASAHSSQ